MKITLNDIDHEIAGPVVKETVKSFYWTGIGSRKSHLSTLEDVELLRIEGKALVCWYNQWSEWWWKLVDGLDQNPLRVSRYSRSHIRFDRDTFSLKGWDATHDLSTNKIFQPIICNRPERPAGLRSARVLVLSLGDAHRLQELTGHCTLAVKQGNDVDQTIEGRSILLIVQQKFGARRRIFDGRPHPSHTCPGRVGT